MNSKSLLLTLLCAALATLTSQAKPNEAGREGKGTPPAADQIIERLDTDASGTLSQDEAKGPMAKNFSKIDADANGEITQQELATAHENRGQKAAEARGRMQAADTDGNGTISIDEATEADLRKLVENFDKVDADGDGEISKEEMRAMRKHLANRERKGSQAE